MAWCDVCLPKKEGGLGIPNITSVNKAYGSIFWDLASKDTLWVKRCHTYIRKDKCLWACPCPPNASWTWRKNTKLRDIIQPFIKYKVSNGLDTFV